MPEVVRSEPVPGPDAAGAIEASGRPILELDHVTMAFGGVVALNDVSLEVGGGQIFALIGPNGAGKTTIFNVITGVFRPTKGDI
ncbi:MAG: hypothetical protein NVS3B21_02540 [Acidimicrobiales bacterium]